MPGWVLTPLMSNTRPFWSVTLSPACIVVAVSQNKSYAWLSSRPRCAAAVALLANIKHGTPVATVVRPVLWLSAIAPVLATVTRSLSVFVRIVKPSVRGTCVVCS